jgi:hypothetical protein
MGDFTTELAPQHRNRVQPRAIGRQIQQHQPPRRGADDSFDLIIEMGIGVIPGHIDGTSGVFVDYGLQQFGDLPATFAAPEQDDRFARVVIDGTQAIPFCGLTRRGDHDLLPLRAPHRPQCGHPTDVEFVGIVERVSCSQVVAGLFDRLFFT